MLDIINRYAHGFVAIPVILACREKGIFAQLQQHGGLRLEQLIDATQANSGHLQVALRLLHSLGWLAQDADGAYCLTAAAESQHDIPDEVLEVLRLSPDLALQAQQAPLLRKWVARILESWAVDDRLIADFLDGLLVIPVLLALKQRQQADAQEFAVLFGHLPAAVKKPLAKLFTHKAWGVAEKKDGLVLTETGQFMLDRALITGVTASYAPMLRQMSEILFGSHQKVFQRGAFGGESHIDRTLNVLASGFQHDKYFIQVDEIILAVFDRLPFEEQPKYVADMGCGDGSLLKRVYTMVRDKSLRGTVLDQHPLTLIGVDYNQESLAATAHTLYDFPHRVLHGDIGNPEQMIMDLVAHGIHDTQNIWHIRSFLDHDRPYIPPANLSALEDRAHLRYHGVYVDGAGQALPAAMMVQSLTEHLQRWASITGKHGLLLLEVHCLEPATVQAFLDQSESLHFDACQGFSMQHLMEADVFLMAAAEAGLFARAEFSKRFPRTLPFTRITLNWFEKRPYSIRHAHARDLPAMLKLEQVCWPPHLQVAEAELARRLARFPAGQCVLDLDGQLVGVIYSQRIASVQALANIRFADVPALHQPDGAVVQLIAVNILPDKQHLGLGDQLLEFMLQYCTVKGGIERATGVTRCKNYPQQPGITLETYIQQRDAQGFYQDPILRFHHSHGAQIHGLVYTYRPEDIDNQGHGVLIEYDLHQRQTASAGAPALPAADKAASVAGIIEQAIRSVMGHQRLTSYSSKWPLNEMGMDSLDLLELRALLSRRFDTQLDPGFFFQYGTPKAIADYFERTQQKNLTGFENLSGLDATRRENLPGLDTTNAIAIIGMACRFPGGVNNPQDYWRILRDGVDAISAVPPSRWDNGLYYDPQPGKPGKIVTDAGGFIDHVEHFDAAFFRIAPREAISLDPQQRLLLEVNWEALEYAGLSPTALEGSPTGIFTGLFSHDYEALQLKRNTAEEYDTYFATGNAPSIAAGRLAYFFDFHGPALTVDTACSSSLVAVHLACHSLLRGECNLALVSAVNLLLSPELSIAFSNAGMLAPNGRCKTFDAAADGYVRSEGCAAIVLKRLPQALADGDNVLAVIRGSAINQDGMSNGLTAPNGLAQQAVIRQALGSIAPAAVSYVEAHGTGTALGDPVEIKALEAVYGQGRSADTPLYIGSAKTHIGHTEAVAGLAGLLKVVLAMQHGSIPPHLHFKTLNPHIVLDTIPARIPLGKTPWLVYGNQPRLAGISSFGFSGTNAHLIVQEAPPALPVQRPPRSHHLLTLSAKSDAALRDLARAYAEYLAAHPDLVLGDLCYTALAGRAHFNYRLAVVAESCASLRGVLLDFASAHRLAGENLPWLYGKCAEAHSIETAEIVETAAEDWRALLYRLGELYVRNAPFDWSKFAQDGSWRRVVLPTYPFQRRAYWLPPQDSSVGRIQRSVSASDAVPTFAESWQAQALTTMASAQIKTLLCILSQPGHQASVTEHFKRLSPDIAVLFLAPNHDAAALAAQLKNLGALDAVLYLPALENPAVLADYASIVALIQALAASGMTATRVLLAAPLAENAAHCYAESWVGFERSLRLILPKLAFGAVYLEDTGEWADWCAWLWQELHSVKLETCRYQGAQRAVWRAQAIELRHAASSWFKPHGTYLITGGCGGLGALLARELAHRYQAHLILSGRSPLDEAKQALLAEVQQAGGQAVYLQADVTDEAAMRQGLADIRKHAAFATINGVLHVAGVEAGAGSLLDSNMAQFHQVLQPKIAGTLVLETVFAAEHLDFVCYFSSASAVLGDFGTCDYAVANRFLMAFAAYKNRATNATPHYAILWPLWQDGSMGLSSVENTRLYLQSSGLRALHTEEGMALLEQVLGQDAVRQPLVLAGDPARIQRSVFAASNAPQNLASFTNLPGLHAARRTELKGLTLAECVEYDLKQRISTLLRMPANELDTAENLAEFGFDSITLAEFATALSQHYGIEITPSIFFGHSTISALVAYFQNKHLPLLERFYQEEPTAQISATPLAFQVPSAFYDNQAPPSHPHAETRHADPIAIIGMSGRFPGARNLDEFWHILADGQDVISDIPPERFDWRKQHGDTAGKLAWRCGLIPGIDEFDPLFFEISPREAQTMDPRQRLLLQEAWNALEDAGYGPAQIQRNKMGMFVGVERGDFTASGEKRLTSEHEGILAARLAYVLNFTGPVMAINTACSSGLVAAHQACQALRAGECDTAIAAAVNLMLSPKIFLSAADAGMLSPTGRCFAFDRRADGMTPGEAVVALVFKRLSDAQRDQDAIYAVIQGSGINYDGKTNGLTVPNGNAQAELLRAVYERYAINPAQISYLVTHGTGTKLGDPVEINALYETFKGYTNKTGYCALTSSKTNFGHTFAASGLLSLVNLVLAQQHQHIPASLHCQQENPYIHWDASPFYVNKHLAAWLDAPRLGAVSAFGMSGSNAHLVVAGYSDPRALPAQAGFHVLLLSAATERALADKIANLRTFLQQNSVNLAALAMTLAERRQHFAWRCALLAQDSADAVVLLQQHAHGEKSPKLFAGNVRAEFSGQTVLRQHILVLLQQAHQTSHDATAQRDIVSALAELYCQGYELPLSRMYGVAQALALHVPTYPFAKDRYPITVEWATPPSVLPTNWHAAWLHPLLQRNTSTFSEQRFTSVFNGSEFFLAEHQVHGQKILPGVAYLEMARAALEYALDAADAPILLKHVTWIQPLVVADTSVQVHIRLLPTKSGEIAYDIYSETDSKNRLHCQGSALLQTPQDAPVRDIVALRNQCGGEVLDATACYSRFAQMGLQYGAEFRGIETLYCGDALAVAKLRLTVGDEFGLHPGMLDAALQSCLGVMWDRAGAHTALPFAVDSVEMFAGCCAEMWAVATPARGATAAFDIDLCDDTGRVCVRVRGLTIRPLPQNLTDFENLSDLSSAAPVGKLLLQPVMQPLVLAGNKSAASEGGAVLAIGDARLTAQLAAHYPQTASLTLQAEDTPDAIRLKLDAYGELDHIVWISRFLPDVDASAATSAALLLLRLIKTLLALGYDGKPLHWTLVTSGVNDAALHGLAGSLAKEYPHWRLRLLDIESERDLDFSTLFAVPCDALGDAAYYRRQQWQKIYLQPVAQLERAASLYKRGGVYVVIGGAGGIGEVWSQSMISRYQARIIWLGRRAQDAEITSKIERLGVESVRYIQADICDLAALQAAYAEITQREARLDGLVHSALVLADKSLMNMSEAAFSAALAPKITGSINLARVFGQEKLDFWLFFSAMQSFSKAAGQSNYAAGCTFADAFAQHLGHTQPVKIMNWGYWGSVGIVASDAYREQMAKHGLGSIEPDEAMEALDTLMATPATQLAFIKTTSAQHLFSPHILGGQIDWAEERSPTSHGNEDCGVVGSPSSTQPTRDEPVAQLKDQTRAYLRTILAAGLGLPVAQLDARTDFERYGLDSILVVQLTQRLRDVFPAVNSTLLFECRTLEELTAHFLDTEHAALVKLFGETQSEVTSFLASTRQRGNASAGAPAPSVDTPLKRRATHSYLDGGNERRFFRPGNVFSRDIAIVGLSGQYAQATNLSEFWDNLRAGKNCIGEIPPDRWNWQQHPDSYSRWGGFIADVDKFDPLFFNISPREAETIDPQERLFLQTAYACLEDAGYAPSNVSDSRKVGVFVGVMNNNYPGGARHWSIANRVSYHLNFFGPSLAIDTACSSSLTAIYAAMESLRKGDCECALAGGVNLIIDPAHLQRLTAVSMLAHDDRNKAFGAGADGFVDGEGVGALLLKPLAKAEQDGDHIYAVLKGGAINAGGKTSGYTVPNPKAQYSLIAQALKDAGVDARSVSYIEAHGTGTALGDPIEIAGLSKAFAEHTSDNQFCAIGSVKSNIGHCESAAGIAGVSKILLQFQHQQLVPSLHAQQPNPEINFSNTPFTVQHTLAAWPKQNSRRRAGISSFGAGGANAHLILEEYSEQVEQNVLALPLFVLSAKNTERLQVYTQNFLTFLHTHTPNLNELLYTLQVGREALEERLAFQAGSLEDLRHKLQSFLDGKENGIFRGNIKTHKNALALFESDDDWHSLAQAWLASGKYHKVLEVWVKGLPLEWHRLYSDAKPRRASLPTYPFAKERYWLADAPAQGWATKQYCPPYQAAPAAVDVPQLLQRLVPHDTTAVAGYVAQAEALDALLGPLMQAQLATVDEAAMAPQYRQWLHTTRTVFAQTEQALDVDRVWQHWDRYKASAAAVPMQARIALAEAMLRVLPAILTGKTPATDVMFPNSSMAMVENIYKNNALADYFNHILADLVATYIELRQHQDPGATVRLFEIGAGTGGTSAIIFKRLSAAHKQQIQEYCYTDLSKAFLMHAEANYGKDNPFLRYQIFNAALPVEQQSGIAAGAYDVVIATNVLHATRNIEQTLRNAQALLKPHGVLLLHELAQNSLFLHLTFGLLEGWWLFEDAPLRIPGSPAIAPETWQQVLARLNFANIAFPAQAQHAFGLQIIVAENVLLASARRQTMHGQDNGAPIAVNDALPGVGASYADLEHQVKQTICDQLSGALKIEAARIDQDAAFSDYGVDSITGVLFVERLNQALALKLDTTVIFDYASVNRLAAHLLAAHQNSLASLVPTRRVGMQSPRATGHLKAAPQRGDTVFPRSGWEPENTHSHRDGGNENQNASIAIIGMSGRFPHSDSPEALWQHLANGDDLVTPITRWEVSAKVENICHDGGFLQDIDQFDALFFNISGSEATYMDPQQRLFLQEAWKALEDAGYAGTRIEERRCGVYVGCAQSDYRQLFPQEVPAQAFWGNLSSIIPARIAYFLDLQGPALAVDTACSSSLVAIHLACQALWQGDCEVALAGGVFLNVTPDLYVLANTAGMLSPTGRCHTFDSRADGFAPGEGVGVLMLKPLAAALADGDPIHGVIRGIGINQDGATNGITAPSAKSQTRLEREIYDRFQINPEHITLVEAHGTGTILGDPIEVNALKNAFRHDTAKKQYCALGSIKTNIGHAQLAAGVAGVIKVLLAMRYCQIPASLHFQHCNPNIDLEDSPFYVNTALKDWDVPDGMPRLAAVSSFGASGTNAHIVLQDAPERVARPPAKPAYLLALSARSDAQVRQQVEQLLAFCRHHPETDCGNLSRTLLLGRRHFKHRLACVFGTLDELSGALETWLNSSKAPQVYSAALNDGEQRAQPSLKNYGNQCIEDSLHASGSHYQELLATIADLYLQGYALNFERLFQGAGYTMLSLPTYPFAQQRYWVEAASAVSWADEGSPTYNDAVKPRKPTLSPTYTNLKAQPSVLMTFEEYWAEAAIATDTTLRINTLACVVGNAAVIPPLRQAFAQCAPHLRLFFIAPEQTAPASDVLCAIDMQSYRQALAQTGNLDALVYLADAQDAHDYVPLVSLLQALAAAGLTSLRVVLAARLPETLERCYAEAWIGLARSLKLALPKLQCAALYQEGDAPLAEWAYTLWQEVRSATLESCRYQGGQRAVLRIRETHLQPAASRFKRGGVYFISGGCGGLGAVLARYLVQQYQARLILSGRSPLDAAKRTLLAELQQAGGQAVYLQADVADEVAMRQGLAEIRTHAAFAKINGVLHVAGVDASAGSVLETDIAQFNQVLQPKVAGTLVLDRLFAAERLEFVCYFSSASAVLGDFGSCDYALANRFLMAHAAYQNRAGNTPHYAVLWPLWQDGGMGFNSADNTQLYLQSSGLRALQTEEGMALLEQVLAQEAVRQPLVLAGDPARIQRSVFASQPHEIPPASLWQRGDFGRPELKGLTLAQCLEYDLKQQISTLLNIATKDVATHDNLAEFGFDSISLAEFASALGYFYGIEITPAIFFGYSTIAALVEYFQTKHLPLVERFYRQETAPARNLVGLPPTVGRISVAPSVFPTPPPAPHAEPIAIIGMSGRFPGAHNLEEFWHILLNGEEAVREIPPARFDWRKQYGDTAGKMAWRCGLLPEIDDFDPLFFEISPREARSLDPRQRLLLQEAWNALEDAGYGPTQIQNHTMGMFVGVERGDFLARAEDKSLGAEHDGILAARLAYVLNFDGPVMALNTACSSGLVAAHQACLSLRAGECDTAVVAGVNLMLLAKTFVEIHETGMLSPSGHCFAFDRRADGMTPGEAVVALVFKRLSDAQRDHDPIYAVIQGSAINYDGKTNSITMPNGKAQAKLLKSVYDTYAINPEHIGYIVTHGTATKLGDPVEINALYDTFKGYTDKTDYCALTSSKTNFGHTFAASGLLSLVNLVLAQQHWTIPASLHCQQENAYINWAESPFYVNTTRRAWTGDARLGAVSAFGVSGTNAHLVVAGYAAPVAAPLDLGFHPLLLSAATEQALQEKVAALLAFLQKNQPDHIEMASVAMTLAERRQHFQYRYALVVQDMEDAVMVLQQLQNDEKLPKIFSGKVRAEFTGQDLIRWQINELLTNRTSSAQEVAYALAEFYCQGYAIPLSRWYGLDAPLAVHLPGYPFAKERYPIAVAEVGRISATSSTILKLHSLLHHNTSTLAEQRFSSTFDGSEWFLAEHQVQGRAVLPGTAYLEMAHAAVHLAAAEGQPGVIVLEHLVWAQPIMVDVAPVTVHIGLYPEASGNIAYDIYTQIELNGDLTVHSQGSARLEAPADLPVLDLAAVQAACAVRTLSGEECYALFANAGLHYGASFRGIDTLYLGEAQVLAKLHLAIDDEFVLHPGMVDSALQACVGLTAAAAQPDIELPFSIDRVEIFAPCSAEMWARARLASDVAGVKKFDLDLCDTHGDICVRIFGFATRRLKTATENLTGFQNLSGLDNVEARLLLPQEKPFVPILSERPPAKGETLVVLGGSASAKEEVLQRYPHAEMLERTAQDTPESLAQSLATLGDLAHILWLTDAHPLDIQQLIAQQETGVLWLFKCIKALLALGYADKPLKWTLLTSGVNDAAIHGLVGSMAKEYLNWRVRLVESETAIELSTLFSLPFDSAGDALIYREGQWYQDVLLPVQDFAPKASLYQKHGVYVVIGGAGGLGAAWSQYLINRYQAQIIWLGRRAQDADLTAKIDQASGVPPPVYIAADISDLAALQAAYARIKAQYPRINGVLHSALVLSDKSLMNMTEANFRAALAPKVAGTVHLAQVFAQEPLDFMLFFSAMQSFTKAAGQSNYAAGCAFADAFAKHFAGTANYPVKIMNWGYWGSVGVVASAPYREHLAKQGLASIEVEEGMTVLEKLLVAPVNALGFIKTNTAFAWSKLDNSVFVDIYR